MIIIDFIRHAQTEINAIGHSIIGGRSNYTPLTSLGREQSMFLGKYLQGREYDAAYISPALRTRTTADIVLEHAQLNIPRYVLDDLQELSQGDWEGKSRAHYYTPEIVQEMNSSKGNFKAPNGESQNEVEERMLNTLAYITSQHESGEKVLVFGHGIAIRCMQRGLEDFPEQGLARTLQTDNTSIHRVEYDPTSQNYNISIKNYMEHLPVEKRT